MGRILKSTTFFNRQKNLYVACVSWAFATRINFKSFPPLMSESARKLHKSAWNRRQQSEEDLEIIRETENTIYVSQLCRVVFKCLCNKNSHVFFVKILLKSSISHRHLFTKRSLRLLTLLLFPTRSGNTTLVSYNNELVKRTQNKTYCPASTKLKT